MRCSLTSSINFVYQRLPGSFKEYRWQQISLAALVVLTLASLAGVIVRLLSGRVSKTHPIKPLFCMSEIKKVFKDFITLNHSAGIKAIQRNLLQGIRVEIILKDGRLIIAGEDPREQMTVQYTKDEKSETLTPDQSDVVRRWIFPRRVEVLSSIKEAIQQLSSVDAWANYKFRENYLNPDSNTPVLEILGGGEERIFAIETSDGRIWQLCKSNKSDLYYLSQVESDGSRKTEVFETITPEWERWFLLPKEAAPLEQLILQKLSPITT